MSCDSALCPQVRRRGESGGGGVRPRVAGAVWGGHAQQAPGARIRIVICYHGWDEHTSFSEVFPHDLTLRPKLYHPQNTTTGSCALSLRRRRPRARCPRGVRGPPLSLRAPLAERAAAVRGAVAHGAAVHPRSWARYPGGYPAVTPHEWVFVPSHLRLRTVAGPAARSVSRGGHGCGYGYGWRGWRGRGGGGGGGGGVAGARRVLPGGGGGRGWVPG